MSASKTRCAELIRLCAGMDFFPSDKSVREHLVNTLARVAASDNHAERMIDRWLERERKAPQIADLHALGQEVNRTPVQTARRVNRNCESCKGTGFTIVQKVGGITGAAPCPNGCTPPPGHFEGSGSGIDPRAMGTFYQRQFDGVEQRRSAHLASRPKGRQPVATTADIALIRKLQESNRLQLTGAGE